MSAAARCRAGLRRPGSRLGAAVLRPLPPLIPLLGLLLAACRPAPPAEAPPDAASVPVAAVLRLQPGDWVEARPRELVRTLEVAGPLQAVDTALVKARLAGELLRLEVREGDPVRAGQVIGRIDDRDSRLRLRQAEEQAAQAAAQLQIAETTLESNRALVGQGFISRNALDTSVSNAAAARATLQAARAAADLARRQLEDALLRAPITGQVSQRLAQPGERLALDAKVVEIVDLRRIEAVVAVPPQALPELKLGAPARLQVEGLPQSLPARLARLNPAADPGTRSAVAYLALDAHPALRHGLFVNGSLELARETAFAVPRSALRTDRSPPRVLWVDGDRVVEAQVKPGRRGEAGEAGGEPLVEIVEGLPPATVAAPLRVLAGSVSAPRAGSTVRFEAAAPAAAASAGAR